MNGEGTPPPPPLSDAPPYYFSRDSLVDVHTVTHPPHDPNTSTNVHCQNPRFDQDNLSLNVPSDNEIANDRGGRDDLPPPYSPGLSALFSTRLPQHDVNDAPPSYYSLFGQIREAREQSSNNITFLRRVGQIVLNTVGCTILLLVFMSVPIAILVIGSLFVHACPLEPLIPVYLIVGGISGILKNVLLIIENLIKRYSEQISPRVKHTKYIVHIWRTFNLIFNLFMLAWTIAGGYWVYHIYTEVTHSEYLQCTELLYKFGFGIVTSSYILLLMTCMCVCCCAGICLKINKRERREGSLSGSSEPGSSEGDSERDDESEGGDEERRVYSLDEERQSDEGSAFSEEDFRTNTLMSTLDDHREDDGEEYLRRFRYLDSTRPLSTTGLERGILQYDSSPYPSRHRGIRNVQHLPNHYPVANSNYNSSSNSSLPHNERPCSIQAVSDSNDPVPVPTRRERPRQLCTSPENRANSLYITVSSDGYSVTVV